MAYIIIERVEPSNLRKQVWSFTFGGYSSDDMIRVRDYRTLERPTMRHKWRTTPGTNYSARNNRSWSGGNGLPLDKVPLPQDVRDEVVAAIVAQITFDVDAAQSK